MCVLFVCVEFITKHAVRAIVAVDVLIAVDVLLFTNMRAHKPLQPFAPSLVYPAGQSPHSKDPTVLVQLRLLSQPPLSFRHSSTSNHIQRCV